MRSSTGGGCREDALQSTPSRAARDADAVERPPRRPLDNATLRWMVAGTLAFWLVVYEAGRSFF